MPHKPFAIVTGAWSGIGYELERDVVAGWMNKMRAPIAAITPSAVLAQQHRKIAEPGTRKS